MTQGHAPLLDLCAAHALDSLGSMERVRLEHHLQGCKQCVHALAEFREDALILAQAVAASPDAAVKERVMRAVRALPRALSQSQGETGRDFRFPLLLAGGWSAAALFALAYVHELQSSRQLGIDAQAFRREAQANGMALSDERKLIDEFSSPKARFAQFTQISKSPAPLEGWTLFDRESGRAILVFENLESSPDRDFEVWAVHKGYRRSLGILQEGGSGRTFLELEKIPNAASVKGFAVSLEAKGGSPSKKRPSGPIVVSTYF
jgi:hypothetical protein